MYIYIHHSKVIPHNAAFTVICNNISVNPPVNVNINYPIGPRRNTLKPYNHVSYVTETSVWNKCSMSLQQLHSYHKQRHREANANHAMT